MLHWNCLGPIIENCLRWDFLFITAEFHILLLVKCCIPTWLSYTNYFLWVAGVSFMNYIYLPVSIKNVFIGSNRATESKEQSHVINSLILGCAIFLWGGWEKILPHLCLHGYTGGPGVSELEIKWLMYFRYFADYLFSLQPYFMIFQYIFFPFFFLMGTWQVYLISMSSLISDIPCGGHSCRQ